MTVVSELPRRHAPELARAIAAFVAVGLVVPLPLLLPASSVQISFGLYRGEGPAIAAALAGAIVLGLFAGLARRLDLRAGEGRLARDTGLALACCLLMALGVFLAMLDARYAYGVLGSRSLAGALTDVRDFATESPRALKVGFPYAPGPAAGALAWSTDHSPLVAWGSILIPLGVPFGLHVLAQRRVGRTWARPLVFIGGTWLLGIAVSLALADPRDQYEKPWIVEKLHVDVPWAIAVMGAVILWPAFGLADLAAARVAAPAD